MLTLRARQLRFVDEYLIDCNATRAAIAAGYTKRTASQAGHEVLRNPKVAAELSRRQKLLAARHEVTADNVISELGKLGFSNIADFYRVTENGKLEVDPGALADPMKAASISQIEITDNAAGGQTVKIKLADKRPALNDLGRHLGLFNDRSEVAVTVTPADSEISMRDLALAALALINEAAYRPDIPLTPLLEPPVVVGDDGAAADAEKRLAADTDSDVDFDF